MESIKCYINEMHCRPNVYNRGHQRGSLYSDGHTLRQFTENKRRQRAGMKANTRRSYTLPVHVTHHAYILQCMPLCELSNETHFVFCIPLCALRIGRRASKLFILIVQRHTYVYHIILPSD